MHQGTLERGSPLHIPQGRIFVLRNESIHAVFLKDVTKVICSYTEEENPELWGVGIGNYIYSATAGRYTATTW